MHPGLLRICLLGQVKVVRLLRQSARSRTATCYETQQSIETTRVQSAETQLTNLCFILVSGYLLSKDKIEVVFALL